MSEALNKQFRFKQRKAFQPKFHKNYHIHFNPATGCKLPPKKSGEMNILPQEEMQRFLIQAKQDGYYELFLLELGTGLRLGEILALQWDDLNFETWELRITKSVTFIKGELHITEPKTKSSIRVIVLPGSLLKVLENYKATVNSRWMFPSPAKEDAPLTLNFTRRRMQQTLERAQCKKVIQAAGLEPTASWSQIDPESFFKPFPTLSSHFCWKSDAFQTSCIRCFRILQSRLWSKYVVKSLPQNRIIDASKQLIEEMGCQ